MFGGILKGIWERVFLVFIIIVYRFGVVKFLFFLKEGFVGYYGEGRLRREWFGGGKDV